MDPQKITELANLLRNNGDKILNSEFNFTLSGSLIRALNDSFKLIADATEIGAPQTFQVVKPMNHKSSVFRDLQLVHDFVQKTTFLCIVQYPGDDYFEGQIDITKFRSLKRLEVQKTNVKQITGIQPLRSQIQQLICIKSIRSVEDIITNCGGDNSNGFVWNELKIADFSYNQLHTVDSSLEFAQFLQHLNLRHNQLVSVEAIKWLPNLKTLDLSYNRLTCVPQFHMEACKRLQVLTIGNNLIEDLLGVAKLDALTDLDLSDNCLLNHSYLLPLSAIITLKYLNLYGNPLYCHPKHRLATAQFLHKNTSTVKFILDFEPLSKNEKAITGTQQMRHATSSSSYNRFVSPRTGISISGSARSSLQHTPASSFGSQRSFKLTDNNTAKAASSLKQQDSMVESCSSIKKRAAKIRTVEIADIETNNDEADTPQQDVSSNSNMKPDKMPMLNRSENFTSQRQTSLTASLIVESNTEHLEAKKQIETMREKFGDKWLQSENAEMMQSVLGIESETLKTNSIAADEQRNKSRQLFKDYLGEFSEALPSDAANQLSNKTSTPTESFIQNEKNVEECLVSPIKTTNAESGNESTMYLSATDSDNITSTHNQTFYKTADDSGLSEGIEEEAAEDEENDRTPHLKDVYSTTIEEEPEVSEPEDDEETYIVYTQKQNEALFLTISGNFLREKDTNTQHTKTKWSLKILESCDRLKSNTLRINFDTVKLDKQERVYTIEDGLCQELEKKLRDILSQRGLSEMNQTIYRCVNCACQFSYENRNKRQNSDIRCPDCKSTFVAEIHDIPKSLDRTNAVDDFQAASPAAMAIPIEEAEEAPSVSGTNKITKESDDIGEAAGGVEETNSIGSANSLNESSSCSKISNSQSSFDSNQSVVGSSNTDRDADFKSQCESDVDILSNPSQSSIEVLDQMHHHIASRKTSEERRILQIPNLETIDDNHSLRFNYTILPPPTAASSNDTNNVTQQIHEEEETDTKLLQQSTKQQKSGALAHFNLTESSSSGSVTDSVCTAYEHQADKIALGIAEEQHEQLGQKIIIENLLNAEAASEHPQNSVNNNKNNGQNSMKKEETGISSVFGALFQSTNILMSSSKKLIDVEASANIQSGISTNAIKGSNNKKSPSKSLRRCTPYKFNYSDYNDVDHRLKLYFYQDKFEEAGEHFKWLVRGIIYNANTHTLCTGIVVMSTCKCYLMEAFADEQDDVTKWLRQIVSVTADRLESIQLLPWKIGLSFGFRDWGSFLLLLQDILRTDSLLLHFANDSLPSQCELDYQVSENILKRLNSVVIDEKVKMLSIINGCEIQCENAKRSFATCGLLTTDTRLYVTSGNFSWLCSHSNSSNISNIETDIEICLTQFMSNLVEVEKASENVFIINFLDETHNKTELWECTFETKENAESCFNTIGQSWEKLFGVPLFTTTES